MSLYASSPWSEVSRPSPVLWEDPFSEDTIFGTIEPSPPLEVTYNYYDILAASQMRRSADFQYSQMVSPFRQSAILSRQMDVLRVPDNAFAEDHSTWISQE